MIDRTFSRITSGPLTPPTVLYRILGMTEYDDDSRGSDMATVGDGLEEKGEGEARDEQRKGPERDNEFEKSQREMPQAGNEVGGG